MQTTLKAELVRIAGSFARYEEKEFYAYIWQTEFAEWDKNASTDEAIQRANEAEELAKQVWKEEK